MLVRLSDTAYTRIAGRMQFVPRPSSRIGLQAGLSFPKGARPHRRPPARRCCAFFDGQNLFHAAREAFGHSIPNYRPEMLAAAVCARMGWELTQVYFYTGIPAATDHGYWSAFWKAKLGAMGHAGVTVFSRPLRYASRTFVCPHGLECVRRVGREKGIDVRIALDMVRLARKQAYDVALIFSQDQDLTEAVDEIKAIAREQNRWIKVACAYPSDPTSAKARGIDGTDWIPIDRATYDACLDTRDYGRRK